MITKYELRECKLRQQCRIEHMYLPQTLWGICYLVPHARKTGKGEEGKTGNPVYIMN